MKHLFTLNKDERLKSRKLIERLFEHGKSFYVFPFRVIYMFTDKNTCVLQAGFAVTKKKFKKAVDRNSIKRLMREAYRLQKNDLRKKLFLQKKSVVVFIVYVGSAKPGYDNVYLKMNLVLEQLNRIADEAFAENS